MGYRASRFEDHGLRPVGPVEPIAASSRCLFDEDWWLDAAAPGAWDRVSVAWDGIPVGEMAFAVQRRRVFTYIAMPHLTRTMSPRLMPPPDKPARQRVHNLAIMAELMRKLPRHDRFERALDVGCPSLQGFIHEGFAVTHRLTLRTPAGVSPDEMIWTAHRKTRQAITRARRECVVERSDDLDRFIRFHRRVYGDKGVVNYDELQRIFAAVQARNCVEIIFVRAGQADTAATVLVWDATTAYSWVFARDEQLNTPGAFNLLMYEAACDAWRRGRILDVDGYARAPVGEFLTKFGFSVDARPFVNGGSRLWTGYHAMRSLLQPNRYDRTFRVI